VPGPAWAAAEIQRMLTMQAAENSVRSRTPSSRRSFGVFAATGVGGVDTICEIGRSLFLGSRLASWTGAWIPRLLPALGATIR